MLSKRSKCRNLAGFKSSHVLIGIHSVAKYGELAPECADALILYGKALLNNAISKSGVLGGTVAKKDAQPNVDAPSGMLSHICLGGGVFPKPICKNSRT
jgi:hypothetical protein